MYSSGPLMLVYVVLYVWAAASTTLAIHCGTDAPMIWAAPLIWGIGAALFAAVFALRLPLIDVFQGLEYKERFAIFLVHGAVFFAPAFFTRHAPWILSFAALNIPMTLVCLKPNQWHRLLLNANLIAFIALIAYDLPLWPAVAILLFVGVLWVPTAVLDHFASVLERAEQGAGDMGGVIAGTAARHTGVALLIGAPLVWATLRFVPPPELVRLDLGATPRAAPTYHSARPLAASDYWDLAKASLCLVAAVGVCYVLLEYWKRHLAGQGAAVPLGANVDQTSRGETVIREPEPRVQPTRFADAARERIVSTFEDFCAGMALLGRERLAQQTAREYAGALSDLSPTPRQNQRIARTFENARYGYSPLTENDVRQFVKDTDGLRLACARLYAQSQLGPDSDDEAVDSDKTV